MARHPIFSRKPSKSRPSLTTTSHPLHNSPHPTCPPWSNYHGTIIMLQQDLLDTLFLNRKALAGAGETDTQAGANGNTSMTNNNNFAAMKDAASTSGASADVCPVDHKSREAWLKQAQAAAAHEPQQPPQPQPSSSTADVCPVDHKSREAWLKHAQTTPATQEAQSSQPQPPSTMLQKQQQEQQQQQSATSSPSWGWRIPFFNNPSTRPHPITTTPSSSKANPTSTLGQDREVSTIPRSTQPGALLDTGRPSNHETETGADARTGNWVYPSEKMFFDAMKRKGHDTRAADMKTVVPIHNAVNERAWVEIKEWERPYQATA